MPLHHHHQAPVEILMGVKPARLPFGARRPDLDALNIGGVVTA